MKKRNFKALALSALLLGLVVAAPAYADDEQGDDLQTMLASGSCGGGSCGDKQQPNTTTQPNNNPNSTNTPNNQPQDIKKKNSGSCAHILAGGCGCGKDKNNETNRQKLLA